MKPKVGQVMLEWDLRYPEKEPKEVTVYKVGRLYFYVSGFYGAYRLDDFRPRDWYSGDIKLFVSKSSFEVREETLKLENDLRMFFSYRSSGLTLNQLKRVESITEEVR